MVGSGGSASSSRRHPEKGFLAGGLVFAVLLAGCGQASAPVAGGSASTAACSGPAILPAERGGAGAAGDMQVFDDAQSVAEASDVVVEGAVGTILAREPDDPEPGAPSILHRVLPVTVLRVLVGELRKGAVINVVTIDEKGGEPEDFSPLSPGEHVVLFLEYLPEGTPGISSVPRFYVPRSGDYGTFDVSGTCATSRAPGFWGLRRGQHLSAAQGRLRVSVDELSVAVQQP